MWAVGIPAKQQVNLLNRSAGPVLVRICFEAQHVKLLLLMPAAHGRAPDQVPAIFYSNPAVAPLMIRLPANKPGKATEGGPSV